MMTLKTLARFTAVLHAPMGFAAHIEYTRRHPEQIPSLHQLKTMRRALVKKDKDRAEREAMLFWRLYGRASYQAGAILQASGTYPIPSVKLRTYCTQPIVAGSGWRCLREAEHEGPCAAVPKPVVASYREMERNLYQRLVEGITAREERLIMDSVYPTISDERGVGLSTFREVPVGAMIEHHANRRIGIRIPDGVAWLAQQGYSAHVTGEGYYGVGARVFRIVHGHIHITR